MSRATKVQRDRHALLMDQLHRVRADVYAMSHPRTDIPFSDCLDMAKERAPDKRAAFFRVRRSLENLEDRMIAEGRAWRNIIGGFMMN